MQTGKHFVGSIFVLLPLLSLLFFVLNTRLLLIKKNLSTDWIQAILLGSVFWGVWLTLITELLSIFGALQFYALAGSWGLTIVILSLLWWIYRIPNTLTKKSQLQSSSLLIGSSILGVVLNMGGTGLIAIISAPNNWDSMTYHLSRVMHWSQNQSVAHYATHELRQLYLTPWAEFAITHLQILSGGDRLANLVQWFSMVGSVLGVSFIASQLGANGAGQTLATLVAATIPMGILQAVTTQNDYVVSFWLVCFVTFILLAKRNPNWFYILGVAGSLSLALLTKGTAYLLTIPFLIWFGLLLLTTYRWQVWQPFLVIGVVVLVINSGYYYRNFQLFDAPLQPQTLGKHNYANQIFTPRAFTSNIIRNIALHINTPSPLIGRWTEDGVQYLHDNLLGLGVDDPRITWPGTHLTLDHFQINENVSGNFIHLILIFVAGGIIVQKRRQMVEKVIFNYTMLLVTAFLLFAFYLKWQPWHSRLHLPLFVLWSPVIGITLSRLSHRRYIPILLAGLLIIQALPFLLTNPSHPLVGSKNIFNQTRLAQYFLTNSTLEEPYRMTAQRIVQAGCRQVGLILPVDFWEYPFWVLLQDFQDMPVEIKALDVNNETAILQSKNFEPCAVICVKCSEKSRVQYIEKLGSPELSYDSNLLFIEQ